jgi:ABC-2 type transport system permease protein
VLVAPVPRWSIALGKILGGSILAFLQGLVFVLIAPALGIHFTAVSFLFTLIMIFGISFGLTGLGFLIAWQMDSLKCSTINTNLVTPHGISIR